MGAKNSGTETLLRQWEMLRAIPRDPDKITATQLCARLETAGYAVTKRTVERDLQELSVTFPLQSDEDARPFKWYWGRNAPVCDVPNLSMDQALAFAMVENFLQPLLPALVLDQLKPHFALAKQRLSNGVAPRGAKSWMGKIAAEPPAQPLIPPRIDASAQTAVTNALLFDKQVKIKYVRRGDDKPREYVLNPLALIQRGPITYVVGTLFGYTDVRTFALHRVRHATLLDEPVHRPRGFALTSYLETGALHFGTGERIALDAVFDAEAAEHLHETPLAEGQMLTQVDDGHVRLQAVVLDTPQLRWWLRAFGEKVEIKAPKTLRKEFAATAAALANSYGIPTRH